MDKKKMKRVASIRDTWKDKIFVFFVYTVVILVTLCCLYPLYFTVIASISEASEVYGGRVNLLPSGFNLDAYKEVIKNNSIWKGYANSIFYTVAGTIINLLLTIPTSYALSRQRMFGRNVLMILFVITMYFGGGLIPTYMLFKNLNLINTPWIMLVCSGLSVYNIIVTRSYFQTNIPEGLHEAARIDGANDFKIFRKIILPLSKPIIAVITLYYAVGHWNGYFNAMIYLTDTKLHPLQLVLRKILVLNESALETALEMDGGTEFLMSALRQAELAQVMKFALVFISSAPMLAIYPLVQKHFIKGIMVGSLKG